ncbi:hypothetical protein [Yoonia litorea]|uniref:Uncharacterized protein n=1 Tax=Yoonia litorea TaxID=1123755 RepID=A0A1I6MAA6_9RHOB|nr:hypothetical protein [Yoonia litorea]SFS12548.1 hypothetical protein SAMN05444714_1439 [Yoonia litorea]
MTLTALLTLAGLQALIAISPGPVRLYRKGKSSLDRLFGGLIAALGARIAYQ